MTTPRPDDPCELCRTGQPHPKCSAHRSKDRSRPCMAPPRRGTHVCRVHGGSSPQVQEAVARQQAAAAAEAAARRHALPVEVDPVTALLQEVHRAAGWVQWLEAQVRRVDPEALIRGTRRVRRVTGPDGETTTTEVGPGVHLWLDLLGRERDRLRAVCRDAIAAGIEERRLRLAEQQGAMLADWLQWLLAELGRAEDPVATDAVVRMLHGLDGGLAPGGAAA